ncbi:MAG: thermonuclease family protein [Bacilli bacterium]|nr:thermonuclease family protein [Bacilli bacterium]
MKKTFTTFFIFFLIIIVNDVQASDKIQVYLNKCVDGDTAWFYVDNQAIKFRFLAIDTPESTNKTESYGKKSSVFTCNKLKNANIIEIEYDENSDTKDKYGRHLAWIFVDNRLLQSEIIRNGLGEIKYIYGNYKYLDVLKKDLLYAKNNKLNIWSNNNYDLLIITLFLIIILISNNKVRKKIIKMIIRKLKK